MYDGEETYIANIGSKDASLREFFSVHGAFPAGACVAEMFAYVAELKARLGNLNNDLSFLSVLLAKAYLQSQFPGIEFDAGAKAQGAPGPDISLHLDDGRRVHCEIKTTTPYQPGFGAQQKTHIKKDLDKLRAGGADLRYMMVTDDEAFAALCRPAFRKLAGDTQIVNLRTGDAFLHPVGIDA